ncbi:MAG: phosphoribosyl-AMP cyclohydrolase [Acidimicrobiales bacterium]
MMSDTTPTTPSPATPSPTTPSPAASPNGIPLDDVDRDLLELVKFDGSGLVAAVVQDAETSDVLMLGYMDREALGRTIATGRSWFFSRSRQEYWCKGESSGDRQFVREVRIDCDGDALLIVVDQHGDGACHTKEWSCFYRSVAAGPGVPADGRERTS